MQETVCYQREGSKLAAVLLSPLRPFFFFFKCVENGLQAADGPGLDLQGDLCCTLSQQSMTYDT